VYSRASFGLRHAIVVYVLRIGPVQAEDVTLFGVIILSPLAALPMLRRTDMAKFNVVVKVCISFLGGGVHEPFSYD
jgi:hypothetical protein